MFLSFLSWFLPPEDCTNGVDDDADGLVDCRDDACGLDATCCDAVTDVDADGWCDSLDNCPLVADPSGADADRDGFGDVCDGCPTLPGSGARWFGHRQRIGGLPYDEPSRSARAGDVDGDGDIDVLVAVDAGPAFGHGSDGLHLFTKEGGGFHRAALPTGGFRVEAFELADLDVDGDLDVVAAVYDDPDHEITALMNDGAGDFTIDRLYNTDTPLDVATLDSDEDGVLEVVYTNYQGTSWAPYGDSPILVGSGEDELAVGDFDGDGAIDLASSDDGIVRWMRNLGGGMFAPELEIARLQHVDSLSAADLDEDGDDDLIGEATHSVWGHVPGIAWWVESLGGGAFGPVTLFPQSSSKSPVPFDADGDGDVDVASGQSLFENQGGGVFVRETAVRWPPAEWPVDMNGDGVLDLIGLASDKVVWYPGLAACAFGDTDGDGLMDVEELNLYGSDPALSDTDGDGLGDFDEGVAGSDPTLVDTDGDTVLDAVDNCPIVPDVTQADVDYDGVGDVCDRCDGDDASGDTDRDDVCDDLDTCLGRNAAGDVDGDGWCSDRDDCPDVADPAQDLPDVDSDGLADPCDPCFGDDRSGDPDLDGVCSDVDGCDLVSDPTQTDADGDGAGDVCDACFGDDTTGDPDLDGICNDEDVCDLFADPAQADTDGDGTGDLCDACPGVGDGLSLFDERRTAPIASPYWTETILVRDLDGQFGDEVVLAHDITLFDIDNGISVFTSVGGGTFAPEVSVPSVAFIHSLDVADADGDGQLDILGSGVLFRQDVGVFSVQSEIPDVGATRFGDIDGDGDPDVVGDLDGDLVWFENLGGTFGSPIAIDSFGSTSAVALADLTGDGTLDVLSAQAYRSDPSALSLVRNDNLGGGTFGAPISYGAGTYEIGIEPVDVDNDGDIDVVYVQSEQVRLLENLGGGVFAASMVVLEMPDLNEIALGDADGDGDADLFAVGSQVQGSGSASLWLLEGEGSAFVRPSLVDSSRGPWDTPGLGDVDGDGDLDVVQGHMDVEWLANLSECVTLDTDADDLPDPVELLVAGTDPGNPDTDGGGVPDGVEHASGADPLDPSDD